MTVFVRSVKEMYRELANEDVEMLLGVRIRRISLLRHQQAPRRDGQGEGGPRRDAQALEERDEIRIGHLERLLEIWG